MSRSGILAVFLGAALASPIALATEVTEPTFSVDVTFGSPVTTTAAVAGGGGGTILPPPSQSFSLVDSLALKQVPVRSGGILSSAALTPPCLFTLTLTQSGDDDQLCRNIRSSIQNGTAVTVSIDFQGLGSAQGYTWNPGDTLPNLMSSSASILLTHPVSICWNDSPGDDDDFDDIADLGMNKVTITFTSMQPGGGVLGRGGSGGGGGTKN